MRHQYHLRFIATLTLLLCAPLVDAADDDVVWHERPEAKAPKAVSLDEVGPMNPAAIRAQLDHHFSSQLAAIDEACSLTDEQRRILLLAGRGDTLRLIEESRAINRKFAIRGERMIDFADLRVDLLQQVSAPGADAFGEKSFFHKVLVKQLTVEQYRKYLDFKAAERKQARLNQINKPVRRPLNRLVEPGIKVIELQPLP